LIRSTGLVVSGLQKGGKRRLLSVTVRLAVLACHVLWVPSSTVHFLEPTVTRPPFLQTGPSLCEHINLDAWVVRLSNDGGNALLSRPFVSPSFHPVVIRVSALIKRVLASIFCTRGEACWRGR
jgi:hypothetical protein